MDELVKQALAKWPNVPDCYGWLALDGRGRWRIGEQRETISHMPTIEYINRNYLADEAGRWFFQNGPQRVFVDLDFTPFVWRLIPITDAGTASNPETAELVAHIGEIATHTNGIWLMSNGRFLIEANQRVGILHDHDSALLLERLCHADGSAMDEAASSEALAVLMASAPDKAQPDPASGLPAATPLHLRLPGTDAPLPLQAIASGEIAWRFRFNAKPGASQGHDAGNADGTSVGEPIDDATSTNATSADATSTSP